MSILSWANWAGSKVTSFFSLGPRVTSCSKAILPMRPLSLPLRGLAVAFWTRAVTVSRALSASGSLTSAITVGKRMAPGPLVLRYTSRHRPIDLSGGAGFQSTKVMPRSFSLGVQTSTATTFWGPGLRCSVTLNS